MVIVISNNDNDNESNGGSNLSQLQFAHSLPFLITRHLTTPKQKSA